MLRYPNVNSTAIRTLFHNTLLRLAWLIDGREILLDICHFGQPPLCTS